MKKIIATITLLFASFVLIACDRDNNGDKHYDVYLEGITASYENFNDDGDFDKTEYFLQRNTEFKVHVYFKNELNLEINSVTINNIEYLKEAFEEDSSNTIITLSFNTQNNTGVNPFKVDSFTYTKDGKVHEGGIEVNDTILIKVQARFVPVVTLTTETAHSFEYELELNLSDRESLIDLEKTDVLFELFFEDRLIKNVNLEKGLNSLVLKDLEPGYQYKYTVTSSYDINDGQGIQDYVMFEGNFNTTNPFDISFVAFDEDFIEFSYENITTEATLNKIELMQNGEFIKNISLDENVVSGLEKGTVYDFAFNYSYKLNGKTVHRTQIASKETYEFILTDVVRNGAKVPFTGGGVVQVPSYLPKNEEVRAVWFSTVSNIDIGKMVNVQQYKDEITLMLDRVKEFNMNAVFFQVRPMNDAWYESDLAPWSRYITGIEGEDPGFDILEFAIEEAHKREIELHAWLNPYRVSNSEAGLQGMDEKNFALQRPDLLMQARNSSGALQTILDPGQPEVQFYIRNVILEILNNYPTINGIHFDDYFYLDRSMIGENATSPDYQTYLTHRKDSSQSIVEFRRESVTKTIRDIYYDVEDFNERNNASVKFGISPSGIWANNSTTPEGSDTRGWQHLIALYADTKAWIEEGIIHYIIPQIYWDFDQTAARYANLVHWWSETVRGTNVDLIIGMGPYRQRDGVWPKEALAEQLRFNQLYEEVDGVSFFTYKDLNPTPNQNRLKETMDIVRYQLWTNEAKIPWDTNIYN